MLEAIVPISDRAKERRNLERLELLIKSCALFWKGDAPLCLHIIVPDDEREEISLWLLRHKIISNLDLRLLTESEVSPVLGSVGPGLGIMKQMLIKLAAFSFVKADNCLIFDSDIVACQPFSAHTLIPGGRILTEWLRPSRHEWWRESYRVLGYEYNPQELACDRIFVTPQILSRHIVTPLLKDIETRYGASWMMALIAEYSNQHPNIWTEYTLYDLFAERQGLRDKYHCGPDEMPGGSLHCMAQSIWMPEHYTNWAPERALSGEDKGVFMVLQSIMAAHVDFEVVRKRWEEAVRTRYPAYIG